MRSYVDCVDSPVNINCVLGFILLMYLYIFYWMEAENFFLSTVFPRISCLGPFVSDSDLPGVDGRNTLRQKMAEATLCTIVSLDVRLNSMVAWVDLTRSLTVGMKRSI